MVDNNEIGSNSDCSSDNDGILAQQHKNVVL